MSGSEEVQSSPDGRVHLCVIAADIVRNAFVSSLLRSVAPSLTASGHTANWERDQLALIREGNELEEDGGMDRHYNLAWAPPGRPHSHVDVALTRGPVHLVVPHIANATALVVLSDELPFTDKLAKALQSARGKRIVIIGEHLPDRLSDSLQRSGVEVRRATADSVMLPRVWRFICGADVSLPYWHPDGSVSYFSYRGGPPRARWKLAAVIGLTITLLIAAQRVRTRDTVEIPIALTAGLPRLLDNDLRPGDTLDFEVDVSLQSTSRFVGVLESVVLEGPQGVTELVPFDLLGTTIAPGDSVRRGRVIIPGSLAPSRYRLTYVVRASLPAGGEDQEWRGGPSPLTIRGRR